MKVALARIVTLERELADVQAAAVMQAGTVQGAQPQQVNDMSWELRESMDTFYKTATELHKQQIHAAQQSSMATPCLFSQQFSTLLKLIIAYPSRLAASA